MGLAQGLWGQAAETPATTLPGADKPVEEHNPKVGVKHGSAGTPTVRRSADLPLGSDDMPIQHSPGQGQEPQGMVFRYILFLVLSFGILMANAYFTAPKRSAERTAARNAVSESDSSESTSPQKGVLDEPPRTGDNEPPGGTPQEDRGGSPSESPVSGSEPADQPGPTTPQSEVQEIVPAVPERAITLGSASAEDPFRMLVTLTNRGAAVVRVELSSPRYRDLEYRSGYLGHVTIDPLAAGNGCPVDVVGPGTPAAAAGLEPGDRITALDGKPVTGFGSLAALLAETKPGQSVTLSVQRADRQLSLPVTLGRQPLEVIRPENNDPLSFLLTLSRIDQRDLQALRRKHEQLREKRQALREIVDRLIEANAPLDPGQLELLTAKLTELAKGAAELSSVPQPDLTYRFSGVKALERELARVESQIDDFDPLRAELPGVNLRTAAWEIAEHDRTHVVFRRRLPQLGLMVEKSYRLAQTPPEALEDRLYPAYHLELQVRVVNTGTQSREVGYQLDGPTGLPIEGKWYANKVGRGWGAVGLRDVVVCWKGEIPKLISCWKIADDKIPRWQEDASQSLAFVGVDAQYFSAILIPQKGDSESPWFAHAQPLRVGKVDPRWKKITNTSCRLISLPSVLAPGGELKHAYEVFIGPKIPRLLAKYGLKDVVIYGWFWWVAIPCLWLLHMFHDYVVFNYGLAIILLTVLVRLCMFPMSKRQTLSMLKMQKLQPELKRIHEKYKDDPQAKLRAQQELFRKHNYNPLSGCLVVVIQLPIFVGLYRGLMVDVELRQAPLLSEAIRWCSNLAGPDMLFDWSGFWASIGWEWFNEGQGLFALGPYFNLMPILTIFLFILQQRMFTPPPADEQAAMQQKIMTFMMVFMGVLFFKVASGLCLYFIASGLWGLAERKLLPKVTHDQPATEQRPAKPSRLKTQIKEQLERLRELRDRIEDGDRRKGSSDQGSNRGKARPRKGSKKRKRSRRRS